MTEGLLHILEESKQQGNEGETISRLLADAVQGNEPVYTLEDLRRGIETTSLSQQIDVLTAIPLLLRCSGHGAVESLNFIGANCSPKESVIALQEALGRLAVSLSSEGDDEEVENESGDDEGEGKEQGVTAISQLVRMMDVYTFVLPRLPKRKRPPNEILQPLIDQISSVLRLAGPHSSIQVGQELIVSASRITKALIPWVAGDTDEQRKCASILFGFVCATLETCSKSIHAGLAQSAFEAQFPRFAGRLAPSSSSPPVEDVVQLALAALAPLGFSTPDFLSQPSIGSLILLAHAQPRPLGSELFPLLRWFLTSIQMNTALDETLAVLLTSLGSIKANSTPDAPSEFIIPLVHVLGPLAGSHPDAPTRHIVFRLLSITLSLAPSPTRLALLRELLSDSETLTPQMQVAAIGLVREAIMEALSAAAPDQSQPNPFKTPALLHEIGPMIFSLQSPAMFTKCEVPLADFMESAEPLRLVESLTLLYLLLQRDTENRTGIRSPEELEVISQRLLAPLRTQIDSWMRVHTSDEPHEEEEEEEEEEEHGHSILQLGIIDMWLERTQSAVNEVS